MGQSKNGGRARDADSLGKPAGPERGSGFALVDWTGEVRSLVLAHHWTLSEVAALTVEQLLGCQQWQLPAAPARVGRDEARAIVAARKEARSAWVSSVLAAQPRGDQRDSRPTDAKRLAQRRRSRVEQAVAKTMGPRSIAGRSAAKETPRHPHDRQFDLSELAASARVIEVTGQAAAQRPVVQNAAPLAALIAELGIQLDRLERRIQRGAPLGP